MPLSDEQAEDLYRKVCEIHAAMLARRAAAKAPTIGQAVAAVTAPKQPHDPADPVVKLLPRNWKGEDLRGKRYSECPPLFLGQLSHMLDAFADKAEADTDPQKQRYAKWDRQNAETARRWRAKLEGSTATGEPMTQQQLDETF